MLFDSDGENSSFGFLVLAYVSAKPNVLFVRLVSACRERQFV